MVGCGSVTRGTTIEHGDMHIQNLVREGRAANMMLVVTAPSTVTATTCSAYTEFRPDLSIYSACPVEVDGDPLAVSSPAFFCGLVTLDVHDPGTYYLVVSGTDRTQQGNFELTVTCTDAPTPQPTPVRRRLRRGVYDSAHPISFLADTVSGADLAADPRPHGCADERADDMGDPVTDGRAYERADERAHGCTEPGADAGADVCADVCADFCTDLGADFGADVCAD